MKNYEYRKCVYAFLDILGFKEIVKKYENSEEEVLGFIKKLENLISGCIRTVDIYNEGKIKYEYTIFSDSVCIWSFLGEDPNKDGDKYSYEYAEMCYCIILGLCQIVASIQRQGLMQDILFRGAISIGKCYCSNHVMYSSALVKAYLAESNISLVPRVIIYDQDDDNILKMLRESLLATGWVCSDDDIYWNDKWLFVDYIGSEYASNFFNKELISLILNHHRDYIVKCLYAYKDNEQVYEKYEWLATIFNSKLRPGYKQYTIDFIELFDDFENGKK